MPSDVTHILQEIDRGDPRAAEALLPLVYSELRRLADVRLAREQPGQTLQPTALVHEAYLRLLGPDEQQADGWDGRGHFFSAAAEAMRRILIDRARAKNAKKRGGDGRRIPLDPDMLVLDECPAELLELDEVLERFAKEDAKKAELVKLRFFAGLTLKQAAVVMGISSSTADRYWAFSRAWLYSELSKGD